MLYFDVKRARLISGALDGLIKVWNITLDYKKSNTITSNSEKRLEIRLAPVVIVNLESFDNQPSLSYAHCSESGQLGMYCNGELFLAQYDNPRTSSQL